MAIARLSRRFFELAERMVDDVVPGTCPFNFGHLPRPNLPTLRCHLPGGQPKRVLLEPLVIGHLQKRLQSHFGDRRFVFLPTADADPHDLTELALSQALLCSDGFHFFWQIHALISPLDRFLARN